MNKKVLKLASTGSTQIATNLVQNVCGKPLMFRWVFCIDILFRKNPFTGKKVGANNG